MFQLNIHFFKVCSTVEDGPKLKLAFRYPVSRFEAIVIDVGQHLVFMLYKCFVFAGMQITIEERI